MLCSQWVWETLGLDKLNSGRRKWLLLCSSPKRDTMAVALDPHPRYRVFYSIIVIQLQQEQKYNDKAVRSETPSSTGVRRIQSIRHFRAPQFINTCK